MKYSLVQILARNVIFSKKSEELFEKLLLKAANDSVRNYVNKTLRTFVINDYPTNKIHVHKADDPGWVETAINRGDTVYDINISRTDEAQYLHWIDYLNTLPPAKVNRISVKQLEKQVADWDRKLADTKRVKQVETIEGVKPVKSYPDGYVWVELTGKDALALEGNKMGHCVGGDGYAKSVAHGSTKIYSLRDKKGNPHVTVEYSTYGNIVTQIKGKSNNPPISKYRPLIIDFINNELKPKQIDDIDVLQMGLILNEDNTKIQSLDDFKGDTLKIKVFDPKLDDSVTTLPNIESNHIELNNVSLSSIGSMHTSTESVIINNSNIGKIDNISSNYSVQINESKVESIENIECLNFETLDSTINKINIIKCGRGYVGSIIKSVKEIHVDALEVRCSVFGVNTEFHVLGHMSLKGNKFFIGNNSEVNKLYIDGVKFLSIGDNSFIEKLTLNSIPSEIKIGKNVSIDTLNIIPHIDNKDTIDELKKASIQQYQLNKNKNNPFNK